MVMTVSMFLLTSIVMFAIGVYGLIARRNMLRILLSAEIIFNAALLALLALSSIPVYMAAEPVKPAIGGVIALFAIGIAAAEVGVTVAIAVLLFHTKRHIDVYELEKFRG